MFCLILFETHDRVVVRMIIDDYDSRFECLSGQRANAFERIVGAVPVEDDDGEIVFCHNLII